MMGHLGAAMMGRTVAKRAGYNGMLGLAVGLAGSILLRRWMPTLAAATIDGLSAKVSGSPASAADRAPHRR